MTVLAHHFTADTLRDGSPVPPIGEPSPWIEDIEICKRGWHASERAFDALQYAPGPKLHHVRCEGRIERRSDKLVCQKRTILATIDATQLLRRFAADCALDVIHLWDAPDIVREYLADLDEAKRAAAQAAWAARDAAQAAWAARDAAQDAWAAWDAAQAAWAAWDAARAAWAAQAARAAWAAQAAWAAWDAAQAAWAAQAARDVAGEKYAADFNARVEAAFVGAEA